MLYGKNGELLRTASIREKRGHQSDISWTDTVGQVEPWTPDGRWKGEKLQISPDLSRIPLRRFDWQWMDMDQSNHFFPDGIILRCPERIIPGQDFSIQVVWRDKDFTLQIITARYDNEAHLISVTHHSLTPKH